MTLIRAHRQRRCRRGLFAAAVVCATLAGPAVGTAAAASVDGIPSLPTFNAAAGETNDLTVTQTAPGSLTFDDAANAITTTNLSCVAAGGNVTCTGVIFVSVNLLDMDDQTRFSGVTMQTFQTGGLGNDTLRGTSGGFLSSNGNEGNDRLESPTGPSNAGLLGDAGDDVLVGSTDSSSSATFDGGAGADDFQAGAGQESVTYAARTAAVTATLDDAANDGEAGEGDNVRSGIDTVIGGSGNDSFTGSATPNSFVGMDGNDAMHGGDGDDMLDGGAGADEYDGGAGFDSAFVAGVGPAPTFTVLDVTVTLDDVPNDGAAGDGDNVRSSIEAVTTTEGKDTITGTASVNVINGRGGDDKIDGGAGSDVLYGEFGNDSMQARDGFNDLVDCGAGNADTAVVDTLDTTIACEDVQRADVGSVVEDRPPTVAFTAPAPNAQIPATGVNATFNATDDKGVARVVLIDDGAIVGTDAAAPYSIRYQPTGEDVGRDTLVAMAIDTSEQAGTAFQRVTVNRFTPRSVSQRVTPSRDRRAPYRFRSTGTVALPAGVTRAQGCGEGIVSVQVKRGTRTVSTRRVTLKRDCSYSSTVSFANRRSLGNGRLRFTARFLGNEVLGLRTSPTRSARAG